MSKKQRCPGTTTPSDRIDAKVAEKLEPGCLIGDKEKNPNTKTGSKYGKRKRARKDPRPKLRRKKKTEGVKMSDIIEAVRHIIRNHGNNVNSVLAGFDEPELLSRAALKCMATCLSGWEESSDGIISENTDMVLSKDSWVIASDGSAQLSNGFKFNYDWLYDLANSRVVTEDIDETEVDKDSFADTLSNASNLLRKLSDKEVKKYILNAAKVEEDVDVMNLKEVLEDSGVNWKFVGAEVEGDKINLLIRVRYTKDGTQEGVVEKKLSIEVKPSADVTEEKPGISDSEVDLGFPAGEADVPERAPESEPALDLELPEDEFGEGEELLPKEPAPEKEEELEGGMDGDLDIEIRL